MKTFFTSDTHFGHKAIIGYDEAPFGSIEEYDEALIERWNSVVGENDIVYHLGDFCFGNHAETYLRRLNGHKVLVMGNHDQKSIDYYRNAGFEKVYDHPIILRNFFILSHEPLFIAPSMPYMNIFGHVHIHPAVQTKSPNTLCVCACRHGYTPIRVEEWERFDPAEHANLLKF